jgi:hypothetical protein
VLAHESGLSPDGNVFWAASTSTDYIFAVDISDALLPTVIYQSNFGSHGINIGDDGSRTYLSQSGAGLMILDTTEVQDYVGKAATPVLDADVVTGLLDGPGSSGAPQVTQIAKLDWGSRSIPQNSVPFTSNDSKYLMEVDEFGSCEEVGAARIIDINDETNPFVLSNLRLEVHDPANFDAVCDDPGTQTPIIQGYGAHYCHIPTRVDPTIVACSMIVSGLRIFDISDVANPVEVAYFNAPVQPRDAFGTPLTGGALQASNWAMSSPAFAPERNEVWYTDAFQGFFAVRLTNDVWPEAPLAAPVVQQAPAPIPDPDPAPLPVTGAAQWLQAMGALMVLGAGDLRRRRRRDDRDALKV